MSKLEIEFELTGLKLKIKGEREDVPHAVAAIQRQLATMMQATGAIASGDVHQPEAPKVIEARATEETVRGGKRGAARKNSGARLRAEAVDFIHNAEKFGFPKQEWNTATKAMWLLSVIAAEGHAEATAGQLASTFNKHFKTFGPIQPANVLRDLAKEKGKSGWVNSDTTKDPQTWFLLEEGKKAMAKLIEDSKAAAV